MSSQRVPPRSQLLFAFLTLVLAFLSGSCADAPSGVDLPGGGVATSLALAPRINPALASSEDAPIHRIRLTAEVAQTGQEVGQGIQDVDPGASQWTVRLDVRVPAGSEPVVLVVVELINVTNGVESVEWSGETPPIVITPRGQSAVPAVDLVRGPPDNLKVTAVDILGAPAQLRRGKSAQLTATLTTSEAGGQPEVFWTSLSPEVGSVSGQGLFQSLTKGSTRVVATAGAVADTVTIQVLPALSGVALTPASATLESLGADVVLTAQVMDEERVPAEGETVTWTVAPAGVVENRGGGTFRAIKVGIATVTAASTSEPTLTGSSALTVTQLAATVVVTPSTVTLSGVGELAQFTASAADANQNAIPDARFLWSSGSPAVASVDTTGLATALGGGLTQIRAEFLRPGTSEGTGVHGEAELRVEGMGSLAGRVVSAESGTPLSGATVEIQLGLAGSPGVPGVPGRAPEHVTTDSDGRFVIPDLPAGTVDLLVYRTGYLSTTYYGAQVAPNVSTTLETVPLASFSTLPGNMAGRIVNAVNAQGISGVSVSVRSGMRNFSGAALATRTTDSQGGFSFLGLSPGTYTIAASGTGFTDGSRTGYVLANHTVSGQDVVLSPTGSEVGGQLRIVLTWGASPYDLDAHLFGPSSGGRFHVYFGDDGRLDGPPWAALDVDDIYQFGPETVTALLQPGGPYRYFVHDFSNYGSSSSTALGNSGARVDVFRGTLLIRQFYVPAGPGTVWEVFTYENGVLLPVNVLSNQFPPEAGPTASQAAARKAGVVPGGG